MSGPDLRLRRRARRHRAVRPPARVQPDLRRVRAAGALVGGGVRREAQDRGRQGAHGEPVHPGASCAQAGLPDGRRGADGHAGRPGTRRKTAIYTRDGGVGRAAGASRGSAGDRRGARRRLDARGGLHVGRGVRAGGARPRRSGDGAGGPLRRGARRRRRARARSRHPTSTSSRSSGSAWRPRTPSWSRTPATACEAAAGAGLRCVVTVNGYTADEDFDEARSGRELDSATRTASGPTCSPTACRAQPRDWVTLRDLEACLDG